MFVGEKITNPSVMFIAGLWTMLKERRELDANFVVDDYATMRRIVRNLLTQIGYNDVDEASDGVSALQNCGKQVRLGDLRLEHEPMTGLQLLKEIRADVKLNATPSLW
ncbi:hypothetical protein CCP2SC5_2310001 [Azospirillaceae bacterium]